MTALSAALASATETNVTYRRGEQSWTIPATRGGVSYGTIAQIGAVPMDIDYREYLIRTAALPAGFVPQNRDVIDDAGSCFEVFRMTDKACWRYSNPGKTIIRVYTRRIQ